MREVQGEMIEQYRGYEIKVFWSEIDNGWYYVKKKYKLNVDFFAESTESDSAVFRNHVFQIIQSG